MNFSIFRKLITFSIFVSVFLLFLSSVFLAEAASDKTAMGVKSRMLKGENIPVIITLKDQPSFKTVSKENAVISMKSHALGSQEKLSTLLKDKKDRGKADKIKQFWIVNAIAVNASPELIEELSKRDDVARIELDSEVHILEDFSAQVSQGQIDSATSEIKRINTTKVWELGIDGTGINVSVIDTGINASHPDIAGRVIKGYDFVNNDADPADDNGHGTHVAGTVGGNGSGGTTTGVAPNVSLFGVKVLDSAGSGSESNVISGIEWSVSNGANVISMSLGGGYWADSNCDSDNPLVATAINNAIALNVVVIAAAGNVDNSGVSSPGCISSTIAVGAVDSNDVIAYFSSIGFSMRDHGVVAPGVDIKSTVPSGSCTNCDASGYKLLSGTSMATPHVSGTAALLLHAAGKNSSTLTPAQIKNILESTSVDLGTPGKDNTYGAGRIDVFAVVATSFDIIPPYVTANPTGYLDGNSAAKNGTTITLNATITDAISGVKNTGVKNASVNISSINASLTNVSLVLNSGFWTNNSVIVNASDGVYYLNITTYDNVNNVNNSIRLIVTVDNTPPNIINTSSTPSQIEAGSGTSILRTNVSDNTSGVARVIVNLSTIGGSSGSAMTLVNGTSLNGTWQLTVNTTSVGTFSLPVNATDGAGNSENMNILLNVTDTTPPVIEWARAAPDSIKPDGIESAALKVSTLDFANVSNIQNVTVNLTQLGGNASQELQNNSGIWQINTITTYTNRSGSLVRLPVNVTDARNNSNTSANILLGIKAQVDARAGNTTQFNFTVDSTIFNASITIPSSTGISGSLLVAPVELPSLDGLTSAGVALNFSNLTFDKSLKIEIEYNSSFVAGNESRLRLWFYNTTSSSWEITGNSSVDILNRKVSGYTSHFSVFAPLSDTTPPAISGISTSSITTSSAAISWTTNEASQSLVRYGTTSGGYTSALNDTANVTSHSIQLTGLSASTTYYYIVNSTDQSGNSAESSEGSFTTSSSGGNGGGGSGGGGGGGGGGGASGENASNIEVKEKYDLHIFKDKVTSYKFSNSSNPVLFINITGNINAGEINTAVEVLKNTSTLVNIPAPGIVYKNINIWVGTSGFAVLKNLKNAEITFRVKKDWINENNPGNIAFYRYDSQWVRLPAQKVKEDAGFEYYLSTTDKFSPFAITLEKVAATGEGTASSTAVIPDETEQKPAPVPVGTTGFNDILSFTTINLALITIILAAVYILKRNR